VRRFSEGNEGVIVVLTTYEEFTGRIDHHGLMPLSANKAGLPSLTSLTQEDAWHTNEVTDPWLWRKRIADEKKAAYGKVFDKKPGFVSLACFPYFLALRRGEATVADLYSAGKLSHMAKAVYELFRTQGEIAAHDIMPLLNAGRDKRTAVENALIELQMRLFLTTRGAVRKTNARGEEHGWPSVVYTTVENWAQPEILRQTQAISPHEARLELLAKVKQAAPDANEKQVLKLIML